MTVDELQARLERDIPISRAMSVKVLDVNQNGVKLFAPLEPNINHQQTAFGGSVNSLAVLSCWCLVTATLFDEKSLIDYVVIQDSSIDYEEPVESDFTATASWGGPEARTKFLSMLTRYGKARVALESIVEAKGKRRARLEGRFVAQLKT